VPSRPYFHGDEDFYLSDTALIAHSRPHPIPSGMSIEMVKVLTRDRRYLLGYWLAGGLYRPSATCWRTAKGDAVEPATLAALVHRCREVFGPNPRYAIDPPEKP
jgi:hypothetical protein